MRILHVINRLGASGAEVMLFNLALALREKGVEQSIVTLLPGGSLVERFEVAGFKIRHIGMQQGVPSVRALWSLRNEVLRIMPDVVVGWMYHSCYAASFGVPGTIPVIWGIHHTLGQLDKEKLLTRLLIRFGPRIRNLVSHFVYVSAASSAQHFAMGYPRENYSVIPNGFNVKLFRRDEDLRRRVREELGVREGQVVFGSAARFHPMKNHIGLLEAFADVANSAPGAVLLMAGREIDGNNMQLRQIIESRKLIGRVLLLGERSDIPGLMNAIDIYVSASNWGESFPLVLGEAMASEVPCIATDLGDCSQILGDTGRLVRPGDVAALRDGMSWMASLSPEARTALGRRARAHVEDGFSLDVVAERYLAVCQEAVSRARTTTSRWSWR